MEVEGSKVTLVAIMKDERPYILEWVAYHRLIGFNEIVIYSNDTTDGSLEMLDALHRAGVLTHRIQTTNAGETPQIEAYKDAVSKCKTEWIAFFDADEFLVLKADAKIQDFLKRFKPEVSAIAINWRIFGSAGKVAFEPGLVIERFTRASKQDFSVNRQVKSIVKIRDMAEMYVHTARMKQGEYVNSSGAAVTLTNRSLTGDVVTEFAQINHYHVKSREEFEQKRRRGRADFPPEHPDRYTSRTDGHIAGHDRNEDEDLSLFNLRGEVEREIERLQELSKPHEVATVLLVGLSHAVGVRNAQAVRVNRGAANFNLIVNVLVPKYKLLVRHDKGRLALDEGVEPELRRMVEEAKPQIILVVAWGDQHFFMSTANLPRRLDFVLPAEPDLALDPAAEIVPYDLMCEQLRIYCKYQEVLVETVQRVSSAPLYLVPAPPPVADFAAIPGGSSNKHIDRLVADNGFAPDLLRYKFWHLINDLYNQIAAAKGAKALPAPPESLQPGGFRLAEYNSTDWMHANAHYGELVLKQIDALLAPQAES